MQIYDDPMTPRVCQFAPPSACMLPPAGVARTATAVEWPSARLEIPPQPSGTPPPGHGTQGITAAINPGPHQSHRTTALYPPRGGSVRRRAQGVGRYLIWRLDWLWDCTPSGAHTIGSRPCRSQPFERALAAPGERGDRVSGHREAALPCNVAIPCQSRPRHRPLTHVRLMAYSRRRWNAPTSWPAVLYIHLDHLPLWEEG